jgi:hypothetical protein
MGQPCEFQVAPDQPYVAAEEVPDEPHRVPALLVPEAEGLITFSARELKTQEKTVGGRQKEI